MCPIGLEPLRVVLAVALDADVVHEVAPLLLEEILAPFQAIEQEISRPRREVIGVVVSGAVKL